MRRDVGFARSMLRPLVRFDEPEVHISAVLDLGDDASVLTLGLFFQSIHTRFLGGGLGVCLCLVRVELGLIRNFLGFDVRLVDGGIGVGLLGRAFGCVIHSFLLFVDRVFCGVLVGVDGRFLFVAADEESCGEGEDDQ